MESLASYFSAHGGAFFAAFVWRSPLHLVEWDLGLVNGSSSSSALERTTLQFAQALILQLLQAYTRFVRFPRYRDFDLVAN